MSKIIFERVAIAGVGLIGGSLALACKKAGVFGSVIGFGRGKQNLETALRLSIVDEVTTDISEAAKGADLFFCATPVETIPSLVLRAAEYLPDGCVITDGGSVKEAMVAELDEKLPEGLCFVGGHPVSGTEKTGAASAFTSLYKDRYTILTPTAQTDKAALEKVKSMWEAAGSQVMIMDPKAHDDSLALISHLPHLAAFCLMEVIMNADPQGLARKLAAGGLKDTTRIAGSDPVMWRDIFSMNKKALLEQVTMLQDGLESFRQNIESDDYDKVEKRIEKVSQARRNMEDKVD